MPFRFDKLALTACLLLPAVLSATSAESGARSGRWAHEDSALKPDSRVTWGKLKNGFRYALLPHDGVPGRVSLRLIVLAGSIDEKDNERGIAHYTEHMSFRDSRDFSEQDMVKFFQTLGMEYGSDVNAVTTFDYTAYALVFREAKPELLTEGLRLFRNFADGVTFKEESINKERGVILSELRRSDNVRSRGQVDALSTIYNGLQVTNRAPIGTTESLNKLSRKDFLEFYKRCYRSDAMILAAVGDFEPAELEKLIVAQFAPMTRPSEPLAPRNLGKMNSDKGVRAGIFRVTNLGSAEVMATSTVLRDGEIDSIETRKEHQRQGIAQALLGERLDSLVLEAGMGGASLEDILNTRTAMALVLVHGENWDPGVRALDQMIRATHQRGFEKRELEAQTKHMLTYMFLVGKWSRDICSRQVYWVASDGCFQRF
jgi:zinc protease